MAVAAAAHQLSRADTRPKERSAAKASGDLVTFVAGYLDLSAPTGDVARPAFRSCGRRRISSAISRQPIPPKSSAFNSRWLDVFPRDAIAVGAEPKNAQAVL